MKILIQINIETKGKLTSIFEIPEYGSFSDISADFEKINLTTLNDGNVDDHTFCSRHISKTKPVVRMDSQRCFTINKSICQKINSEAKFENLVNKEMIKIGVQRPISEAEITA